MTPTKLEIRLDYDAENSTFFIDNVSSGDTIHWEAGDGDNGFIEICTRGLFDARLMDVDTYYNKLDDVVAADLVISRDWFQGSRQVFLSNDCMSVQRYVDSDYDTVLDSTATDLLLKLGWHGGPLHCQLKLETEDPFDG